MSGSEDTYLNFWKIERNVVKDAKDCNEIVNLILFIRLLVGWLEGIIPYCGLNDSWCLVFENFQGCYYCYL